MTRPRRRRDRPDAPQARGRERRPRRPAVAWPFLAVALLALAVFALARVLGRPRAVPAAPDPVASMDPAAALREGTRLGAAGEYARSLPYLRRAVAANPASWEARFNLASSLSNTALQVRRHLGRDEPVLRSSVERLAMLRESERELESALAGARTAHEAALVLWTRANLYRAWGLPLDALDLARRARELEPGWPEAGRLVAQLEGDFARAGAAP